MKKLDKIRLSNKSSRKLALEASTLKLLSCEQLTTAQGGVTQSHGCESAGCY